MARKLMINKAEWPVGKEYCCYCGCQIKIQITGRTKEHLVPVSKGGSDHVKNKAICCSRCNRERGNKEYSYWLWEVECEYNELKSLEVPGGKEFSVRRCKTIAENIKYWMLYVEGNREKLITNPGRKIERYDRKII